MSRGSRETCSTGSLDRHAHDSAEQIGPRDPPGDPHTIRVSIDVRRGLEQGRRNRMLLAYQLTYESLMAPSRYTHVEDVEPVDAAGAKSLDQRL